MKKRISALGMGIILLSFGFALTGCSRDPRLVGRWELERAVNAFGVTSEIEFFRDGTGRMRSPLMPGGFESFTWRTESGRIRMERFGIMMIHDIELSGSTLTFFYDRAANSHAVYRRAR